MRFSAFVLASIFLLTACAEQHPNPKLKNQDIRLTFLHTSDIHGRLLPYRMQVTLTDEELGLDQENEPFGGIARVAYIINRERARSKRVLFLDSGDVFQGAPIFNAFNGEAEFRAMGYLAPDAVVLGNHEFDSGLTNLVDKLDDWLSFPMLAANYYFMPDNRLRDMVHPYTIINSDGVKIGIIGIGDFSSLSSITDVGNSMKILPLDMIETVNYYVGVLRSQVDLVVVLSHAGLRHDQELIEQTRGVDAVFGGHLHIVLDPPKVLKNLDNEDVLLVHSGAFAKYVGRLDVVIRRDPETGRYRIRSHDYSLFPIDSTVKEDPEMAELMEEYRLKLNQQIDLTSVYGYSPKLLTKYGYEGGDSSLGNLVSEAIRRFARTEIGFTNTLGVRANMYPGPITLDDMYNIFPFENTITLLYMSGVDLRRLFDYVAQRSSGRGCVGQLQVAGVRFVMNCNPDPPPYFYECISCGHDDENGDFVETNWAGCLASCIAGCTTSSCWESCLDPGFRTCIADHSEKIEDQFCLDTCLPVLAENPSQEAYNEMLACFGNCFPRSEDIEITTCPDPSSVDDPTKCDAKPLFPEQIYEVATNDYIAQGGSGFTILKSNNTQMDTELPLREAVLEIIITSPSCLEQCEDRDGDIALVSCPVYNDCLEKVGTFMDGFCDRVDQTGGEEYVDMPMGCGVDTGACWYDEDCYPMDVLCGDGGCQECQNNGQCMLEDPDSICVRGYCIKHTVGCLRSRCQKLCETDADCPGPAVPGQVRCLDGACVPRPSIPCLTDEECAEPYRVCYGGNPPCERDDDCGAGFFCEARLCVPDRIPCQGDPECGAGGACVFGFCSDAPQLCDGNGACGEAGECRGGLCSLPCGNCQDTGDCPGGFDCVKNLCVKSQMICMENRCRPSCSAAGDCLPGELCTQGRCQPIQCLTEQRGEALCRVNNLWLTQQRCLQVPCVDSNVDGRIGRILPENLGSLEFGFVPNDPEDLDEY